MDELLRANGVSDFCNRQTTDARESRYNPATVMLSFRDSRSSQRRRALRAIGVVMLVLVSAMALTISADAEQDDDVTPPPLVAQIAPLQVVSVVFTAPPPPPLSAPVTPEYQPPRFA